MVGASSTDLDYCLEQLLEHRPPRILPAETIRLLCHMLKQQLLAVPNIMALQSPISVVGDIHGQFHDLLEIFRIGNSPPHTNYLFLGDYVDRGFYSVETVLLLIVLKLRYPERVFLIRGNHESRTITTNYGFYSEILEKYNGSTGVWACITDLFDYIPLGATIDGRLLAVHGGLSPSCQQLDQIRTVDRFREIPHDGIMADLVWSDPDTEILDFKLSPRGAGYLFGLDVMNKFCHDNRLVQLIRAHQLCNEGYTSYWNGKCLTVWSAPNYCYRCGNRASILEIVHTNYDGKSDKSHLPNPGDRGVSWADTFKSGYIHSRDIESEDFSTRFDHNTKQGVLPGQFFNVFDASTENHDDTVNGKSVSGCDVGDVDANLQSFFENKPKSHASYFL